MRRSIIKLFMDYEKEEKWLNSLSAKGLQLVHYSFPRYVFDEGEPKIHLPHTAPGELTYACRESSIYPLP